MRHPPIVLAIALAFVTAIPCVAHSTDANVLPGGPPVILGKVTRITSHSVIVLTRDGEVLPIEFDSRTVMTTSMPTGCRVRIEFRLLESGRYLAQRITPLNRGSDAWAALDVRHLLRNRPKTRAIAPAVYSPSSTDGQGATKTAQASTEQTTTDANTTNATTTDVTTTDETATDETASNPSAGKDAAVASADGEKEPPATSAVPMILLTVLLMLVGMLLLRRSRRRAR